MRQLDPPISKEDLGRLILALIRSRRAEAVGIYNVPPESLNAALIQTAEGAHAIERVLGFRIELHSGYRADRLNALVGGAKTSQHGKAEAIDFTCPLFGPPAKIAHELAGCMEDLGIDQLILEPGWVHVSFTQNPRRQILRLAGGKYLAGLA